MVHQRRRDGHPPRLAVVSGAEGVLLAPDDIDKVSQEAATLKSRIVQFLIGPKSEWPRYSSAILGQTKEE
jgi:hypothetical protein